MAPDSDLTPERLSALGASRLATHEQFVARLRREHPRKGRFWSQVDDTAAAAES